MPETIRIEHGHNANINVHGITAYDTQRHKEKLNILLQRNITRILVRDHRVASIEEVGPFHTIGVMIEAHWLTKRFLVATETRFAGTRIWNENVFFGNDLTGGHDNSSDDENKWITYAKKVINDLDSYDKLSSDHMQYIEDVTECLNKNVDEEVKNCLKKTSKGGGKSKSRASKSKVHVGPKGGKYVLRKDGSKKYI